MAEAAAASSAEASNGNGSKEPLDEISKRSANIRKYAGDDPEEAMDDVRDALQKIEEQRGAPAEGHNMLEIYKYRDLLAEEKKLRAAAEAAPRIAEERLLEAEERAATAEAKQKQAEDDKQNTILECRKDRRAAAEEAEKAKAEASDKMREAEDMVAAARKEKDDTIAQAFVEAEEKIAAIQADALEVAREQVRDELEEARTESATAEASIDDIRTELESMQTRYAAKLLASEQAAQVLARESKALHGRISTMETEMAVKIQEGRAMEKAKARQEISELNDRLVVAEAKARKAESAKDKAERRMERLKEKVQELESRPPEDPMDRLSRSPPRRQTTQRLRSAATEKRVTRQTEEVKMLSRELNQRNQEFRDLKTEFLNRERDIRLGAADQVDHWMQAAKVAEAHIDELSAAVNTAAAHFDHTGTALPPEIEKLFRMRSPDSPRSPLRVLKSVCFQNGPAPSDDQSGYSEPALEPSFDPEEMRQIFASEERLGVVNREIPSAKSVAEAPESPPEPPSSNSTPGPSSPAVASPPSPPAHHEAAKKPSKAASTSPPGRLVPRPAHTVEQQASQDRVAKLYGVKSSSGASSPSGSRPSSAFGAMQSPGSQARGPRPVVRSRPESAAPSPATTSASTNRQSPYGRDPFLSSESGYSVSSTRQLQSPAGSSQATSPGSKALDRPFSLRRLLAETSSTGTRPDSAQSGPASISGTPKRASTSGITPRNSGRSAVQGKARAQSARWQGERNRPSPTSQQRPSSTSRTRPK